MPPANHKRLFEQDCDNNAFSDTQVHAVGLTHAKAEEGIDLHPNDERIRNDLSTLTLQERNLAYEDVHGVAKPIEETAELLATSLREMKDCLAGGLFPNQSSYLKALKQNPAYVLDDKMLLVWLRCDRFDPDKAAIRYVNYYELKERAFGESCLARDITQADLSPKERNHLRQGHIQILLQRDSAGRAIQFLDPLELMKMYNGTIEEELVCQRACFYLVMRTVLDSVETQRNGIISIVYGVLVDSCIKDRTDFKFPQGRFLQSVGGGFSSVPVRVTAVHFLWNDVRLLPFLSLFRHALGRFINARFLIHYGSPEECESQLMPYGIPVSAIPRTQDGAISYTKTMKAMKKYETRENDIRNGQTRGIDWTKAVLMPTNADILLGRGRPNQDHRGNVQLRDMICEFWEEYDSATGRGAKAAIAERVAKKVQESGGRFLKVDEATEWWFPVPNKEAVAKVCQGFRKKREMDAATGGSVQKDASSGKRSRVQQPMEPEIERSDMPWTDTLTPDEFDFLMEGLSKPDGPLHRLVSDASDAPSCSTEEPLESNEYTDAFEVFLARVSDPFSQQHQSGERTSSVVLPVTASHGPDLLLNFLEKHHYCLKCSPEESHKWLRGQDIMTIADLHDAIRDEEFVELDLIPKGGLKGFKRRPFIKAINGLTES